MNILGNQHNMNKTQSIWTNPVHFFASAFGAGAMPIAPGTFGTIMAIPLVLILAKFPHWLYALISALYIIAAIWACDKTAKDWGLEDPGATASDEVAGFLVTMFAIEPTLLSVSLAFVLFRILDIWKPFPIRWFDKNIHGGIGIVLDDVIAGLVTCVVVHFVLKWV